MSMIDKVARAIAWSRIGDFERAFLEHGGMTMDTYSSWSWCIPEARAAIKAMREPTEAMLKNVDHDPGFCDEPSVPTPDIEIWQAMIDAALQEAKP